MGYFGGFIITARQRGGKNQVTTQYSGGRVRRRALKKSKNGEVSKRAEVMDEKIPKPERLHGRHVLNRYEDGMEKCIGCELCAAVCPAKCIHVRGADNNPENPTSPGERFGWIYEINYLRCIHCDLCVEACPTEAITESKLFEFSFTNRQDAIYTKAELLVGDDGMHSTCRGKTGAQAKTSTPLHGCAQPLHRATQASKVLLAGAANWVTACVRQNSRVHNGIVRIRLRLNHDSCWRYRSSRS